MPNKISERIVSDRSKCRTNYESWTQHIVCFLAWGRQLGLFVDTKVLFKIRISVRGTIKGIRGNLEEWNILQCTWGLFHISKMCEGSHLMVREWGVNLQLPCQRRSGPQSSISRFPEVIIQVAFHDRLAWIVPHLSIQELDEKILVEDSQNTDIASQLKRRFCKRLRYWLEVSR